MMMMMMMITDCSAAPWCQNTCCQFQLSCKEEEFRNVKKSQEYKEKVENPNRSM